MSLQLGIDIGTTTIKVCILRDSTVVHSYKVVHHATAHPEHNHLFDEQHPEKILHVLDGCLKYLSEESILTEVTDISVTGQMHGVILWKRRPAAEAAEILVTDLIATYHATVECCSNLITWQDQRCDGDFLQQFPPSPTFCKISTGFGIASMAWLQKESNTLKDYDMCGTIMDFVVWLLTSTEHVMMTSQNANSWGYFDIHNKSWQKERIEQLNIPLNIPLNLLPKIVPITDPLGYLKYPLHGLETKVKVFPALGDMQCSISATNPSASEAVLNVGTSWQLSFVTEYDHDRLQELINSYQGVSVVPYKGTKVVVTAASLSGGNVINAFVENLRSWMTELGCSDIPANGEMFDRLRRAAIKHVGSESTAASSLVINPTMFGERHNPTATASVTNIQASNCTLGSIVYSLYEGLVNNLFRMLPVDVLREFNVEGICATGGAFAGNSVLLKLVADISGLRVRSSSENEGAASGAAMFSGTSS